MAFHANHVPEIILSDGRKTATQASGSGTIFSCDPVNPGEKINLKVVKKGWNGRMCIGLTGTEPVLYKGEFISGIPRTWCIETFGYMNQDGRGTFGVCPPWHVSTGDIVSIAWYPPTVTVYKNKDIINSWNIRYTGKVWMAVELWQGMRLRMLRNVTAGPGIKTLKELCFEEFLMNVDAEDIDKLPLPKQLKQEMIDK